LRVTTPPGRPPPGTRPGEGTLIGRRPAPSGVVVDWPRYANGMATPDFDCDLDYAPFWAGESCSVVNDIKPAGEIVSRARSRRRGGARGGQGAGVGAFALRRLSAARPAGLRTAKFH